MWRAPWRVRAGAALRLHMSDGMVSGARALLTSRMKGVTRLRQLSPNQERRLAALRHVSRLLDSAMVVPGTSYRIGLDPIVGLVPWLGDLVSPLFTIAILWLSRDLTLPRLVQVRMVINAAIDMVIGIVPIVGDVFDFAWKSNEMYMALLERHAYEQRRASASDWLFVIGTILALIAIAVLPFLILGWGMNVLMSLLQRGQAPVQVFD